MAYVNKKKSISDRFSGSFSMISFWFLFVQELFVEMIAKDALVYAQQGKRKTLQRKDLGKWIKHVLNSI